MNKAEIRQLNMGQAVGLAQSNRQQRVSAKKIARKAFDTPKPKAWLERDENRGRGGRKSFNERWKIRWKRDCWSNTALG